MKRIATQCQHVFDEMMKYYKTCCLKYFLQSIKEYIQESNIKFHKSRSDFLQMLNKKTKLKGKKSPVTLEKRHLSNISNCGLSVHPRYVNLLPKYCIFLQTRTTTTKKNKHIVSRNVSLTRMSSFSKYTQFFFPE